MSGKSIELFRAYLKQTDIKQLTTLIPEKTLVIYHYKFLIYIFQMLLPKEVLE